MFPDNICQNIDILVVINVRKNNFGFHSNQKTQGQKRQLNNLYFKYHVCQVKLSYLNTFLQFRLLLHEPHCTNELHVSQMRTFSSLAIVHTRWKGACPIGLIRWNLPKNYPTYLRPE